MTTQQSFPIEGFGPDLEDLSQEDIASFNQIKWSLGQMLVTIRRSHENAEHEGRMKERAQIAEYLEVVGYSEVAKDILSSRHKKVDLHPKARSKRG